MSLLQKKRLEYRPVVPELLKDLKQVHFKAVKSRTPPENLRKLFPKTFDAPAYQLERGKGICRTLTIGVVFSGGPAAGGHNVIAGILDAGAKVIGFLGGPSGIVENKWIEIRNIDAYRNQGGFDLLGSGRTKIETAEQLDKSLQAAKSLDGLVIIGGDDSNTNAAVLAEYFLAHGCSAKVIGVPKTIDGDLRSEEIEISFGFDSACKTYAETIGNIARDALSSKKYTHFIKLMGRSASHIALECALATQPNLTLITEEKKGAAALVLEIADLVCARHAAGKEYGVILLPEGVIESDLPNMGTDPHGNAPVSQMPTEKWMADAVKQELIQRGFQGKFSPLDHFLGYEGRACMPSNFDANYCYALGLLAWAAVREGLTGVICAIQHLDRPAAEWEMKMVPIVKLMHLEMRLGKEKPVIKKFLVDTKGALYINFLQQKKSWELGDLYQYPGPIQFFGGSELTDSVPRILKG